MEIETIYEIIARKYGVPVEDVRSEIQKAITAAWLNPEKTLEQSANQRQISSASTVPTPEEVITYAKHMLQFH
ncbi:MAG: sporulation initiation factor Spo0A C-terminal domain-containing protein [Candidatus Onthomonas sp.]